MIRLFLLALIISISLHAAVFCDSPPAKVATFTSPSGWRIAEPSSLPSHVKIMVVGEGGHELPPSINLGLEPFEGSLKEYLKIVKQINVNSGDDWKDLGSIQTQAGPASLSQVEMKSKWGNIRQMHVIYLSEGVVYILTAAALREEFSHFYPQFFESFHTFRIEKAALGQESNKKIAEK